MTARMDGSTGKIISEVRDDRSIVRWPMLTKMIVGAFLLITVFVGYIWNDHVSGQESNNDSVDAKGLVRDWKLECVQSSIDSLCHKLELDKKDGELRDYKQMELITRIAEKVNVSKAEIERIKTNGDSAKDTTL